MAASALLASRATELSVRGHGYRVIETIAAHANGTQYTELAARRTVSQRQSQRPSRRDSSSHLRPSHGPAD